MQVKQLVPESLYATYESKLLETTLNSMSDVLPCPRRHCQTAVLIDREESMARCPSDACGFVFCIYCKAAYHGREPCRVGSAEHRALIKEYLAADASGKQSLEKR